jgi:hypothetical protein
MILLGNFQADQDVADEAIGWYRCCVLERSALGRRDLEALVVNGPTRF